MSVLEHNTRVNEEFWASSGTVQTIDRLWCCSHEALGAKVGVGDEQVFVDLVPGLSRKA